MKAYSLDLREKIIATYEAGGITQRELAKRFRVSLYFIVMLLRRWREEQTLSPKPRGANLKPLLTPEIMQFLDKELESRCDLSLTELCQRVEQQYRIRVSTKTMSRMLVRERLGRKKISPRLGTGHRADRKIARRMVPRSSADALPATNCFY
jgi:transposase